jgi:GTP-binding protein EngB required for normal cell division
VGNERIRTVLTEAVPDLPAVLRRPQVIQAHARYAAAVAEFAVGHPRVAACGMYNAGKSTLLNVLSGHTSDEDAPFATGAARCTTEVSEHHADGVVYVDTPGMDGGYGDDATAWGGLASADYLLCAHNLAVVELEEQEIVFLRSLPARLPELAARFVLVLTQADCAEDESDLSRRLQGILDAFARELSFTPLYFCVSAHRFARGRREQKPAMVDRSGVSALQAWIHAERDGNPDCYWKTVREARLEQAHLLLFEETRAAVTSLQEELLEQARTLREDQRLFRRDADFLLRDVRKQLQRADAVRT